jgi:Leucine-rich repeat (LRR) protein
VHCCLNSHKMLKLIYINLHNRIPPSLATIPNLRKLELSRNLLTGSIPSSLYQMQNLQELHIDNNNLGGSLSQVEEPLYIGVREFAVNNNAFEGRFPVEQFEKTEILSKLLLVLFSLLCFFTDD